MLRLFFIGTAIAFTLSCRAQNKDADSLEKLLKNHPAEDTTRVNFLLKLAYAFTYDKPALALQRSNEAGALSEKLGWQKGKALSYRQKGLVYYVQTDHLKAMEWFQKALKAGETMHNDLFEGSVLNNLGNIYADLSQFEKALDFYNRYLTRSQNAGSKTNELIASSNIGSIYTQLSDYPKALRYFEKCLSLAREPGNETYEATIVNNIGRVYQKLGNDTAALRYYRYGLRLAEKRKNGTMKATTLANLGELQGHRKAYRSAEAYLRESLRIAAQLGALDLQADGMETLSNLYAKQNKFGEALEAYKKHVVFRDSVINEKNTAEITRKEMQYGFEKTQDSTRVANEKQQTLAAAEIKQQRTTRNFILGGTVLIFFSGLLLFLSYKRRRDAVTKRNQAELKAQIADTEMKVMRLQMNPHFIFNSLNSIADYIHKNKPQEADAYLSKFAKVMRLTLENSEQKEIPLKEDLKALELYMQLEAKRLNDKFTYAINVSPEIDKENTLVPPLLFQPFVENSIWHGMAKKEGRGHIAIDIRKEGEMLYCLIDDDGVGRQSATATEAPKEKQSLGMKITKARIDILNKLKGANASVQLIDKPQGLSAQVKLPLQTAF